MNKEQQELLDEGYRKYADSHEYFVDGWMHVIPMEHSKESFINKCKTDPEFSEKWKLTIEERVLSIDERKKIYEEEFVGGFEIKDNDWLESKLKTRNIPTKVITLFYKGEEIVSYE
jgi:hypothetical protein